VTAVREVSLRVPKGGSFAIVGRSGAGKSTLARLIAGWEKPDAGRIEWQGEMQGLWVQMIPQDPGPSLHPSMCVRELVEEPLRIARKEVAAARGFLAMCEVPADLWGKKAWELSGGQKARVAIARALAADPQLLILDESLAGLDLISRAQILRLLQSLQVQQGLTLLWVLHDLDFAGVAAEEIAVMAAGQIVERGSAVGLAQGATQRETMELLAARPARRRAH
jgi:peptide/nickel transport system ATP-binding protein